MITRYEQIKGRTEQFKNHPIKLRKLLKILSSIDYVYYTLDNYVLSSNCLIQDYENLYVYVESVETKNHLAWDFIEGDIESPLVNLEFLR
jgi:hypothetical protein